ncbi:MAG TPA: hypothetical protein PK189_09430 [bacterium]|nr:hypothetical protein [bacterium]
MNSNSFTIIELIFVIIIIFLLGTIIYPVFYDYFVYNELKNVFSVLTNYISSARNNQIIYKNSIWYVAIFPDEIQLIENSKIIDKYKLNNKYQINNSDTEIAFNYDGSTKKSNGYKIWFSKAKTNFKLSVNNLTGFIKIETN